MVNRFQVRPLAGKNSDVSAITQVSIRNFITAIFIPKINTSTAAKK
jgi:hypothetical protein